MARFREKLLRLRHHKSQCTRRLLCLPEGLLRTLNNACLVSSRARSSHRRCKTHIRRYRCQRRFAPQASRGHTRYNSTDTARQPERCECAVSAPRVRMPDDSDSNMKSQISTYLVGNESAITTAHTEALYPSRRVHRKYVVVVQFRDLVARVALTYPTCATASSI